MERSSNWIAGVRSHHPPRPNRKAPGRPKLSWEEVVRRDRKFADMEMTDPNDRQEWRGRLRGKTKQAGRTLDED